MRATSDEDLPHRAARRRRRARQARLFCRHELRTRTEEAREDEALDVRRLDGELTSALALAAADYYFDSTTTDDSAQAVISGPGAGRDDIITVRLAQALIDANPEFFEALANDAGVANSELLQTLQSQADANTARDFTPSFI